MADVAELIGDTEKIVRKHYARFVKERQVRLTRILQEAFSDQAKPKFLPSARTHSLTTGPPDFPPR